MILIINDKITIDNETSKRGGGIMGSQNQNLLLLHRYFTITYQHPPSQLKHSLGHWIRNPTVRHRLIVRLDHKFQEHYRSGLHDVARL